MKALILCAGRGSRLKGLTENLPKPLLKVKNKPLLEYVMEAMIDGGIEQEDIIVVLGYKGSKISEFLKEKYPLVKTVQNPDWQCTNMVHSFVVGSKLFSGEDVVVSYGDIIYKPGLIEGLEKEEGSFVLPYCVGWRELWERRFKNPLEDAETFEVDEKGFLKEIGRRPQSFSQVKGQYMGVFKLSSDGVRLLLSFYKRLGNTQIDFTGLFMEMLKKGVKIKTFSYKGYFFEIDTKWDLKVAEEQL